MATDPSFASIPNLGAKLLGSAETDLQTPTQTQTVLTAGASGAKIEEFVIEASIAGGLVASTVAGLIFLFIHDGTNYRLFDVLGVNATTASATAAPFRTAKSYANLVLPPGWSLRASQSVAGNANLLNLFAHGGDL